MPIANSQIAADGSLVATQDVAGPRRGTRIREAHPEIQPEWLVGPRTIRHFHSKKTNYKSVSIVSCAWIIITDTLLEFRTGGVTV